MREGGYSEQNEDEQKENISCKVNEGVYFGDSFNWWGDMYAWFRGSWCFLSLIHTLWKIDDEYTNECRLRIRFVTWFIVKLYCHVTLYITCHILIVSNDIIHMGIKVISWSWLVGDVTKIPDFSDQL